jgi:BirA family biotin operon repressor/biotin-[acetyl-CoA-carboxylase] ligase
MEWRVTHFPILASTNDLALAWIRSGRAAAGDVLVADEQTAGRGRPGRSWSSHRGALLLTAVLPFSPARVGWVALAAGLAAARAVRDLGPKAGVKWPNDVLLDGGKLGGVLVETDGHGLAAVGIGLNVTNALPPGAGPMRPVRLADSLPQATPALALEALLPRLAECWAALAGDLAPLRQAWEELDQTRGRRVVWHPEADGPGRPAVALEVDDVGALRLRLEDGAVVLAAVGEVRFSET